MDVDTSPGPPAIERFASPLTGGRSPSNALTGRFESGSSVKACPNCFVRYPHEYNVCPKCGSRLKTAERNVDPLLGATLGSTYRIERVIGEGGMGKVYEALHLRLPSRKYAVKVLHAEYARHVELLSRFQREAAAAGSIAHPHVVEVFDIHHTDDGRPYIVAEMLEGEDFHELLDRAGKLSVPAAISVARQVAGALRAAHEAGVVHRDLKPENLFVVAGRSVPNRPDAPFVKVLDFGISKISGATAELTRTGMIMGTPNYMAPEQARGEKVDARADVYALGAILYRMVTGRRAFEGDDVAAVMLAVLEQEPASPRELDPSVPERVEQVIRNAMAKDPRDRYASMADFDRDLARVDRPDALAAAEDAVTLPVGGVPESAPPLGLGEERTLDDRPADVGAGRAGAALEELHATIRAAAEADERASKGTGATTKARGGSVERPGDRTSGPASTARSAETERPRAYAREPSARLIGARDPAAGYRRIAWSLILLVLVPSALLIVVGVLLLRRGSPGWNIFLGILVLLFCGLLATGTTLVWVFIAKEQNLSQLQTDFVSKVSHELKTPLTSIRLFVDTLKMKRASTRAQIDECVALLAQATERLTDRIDQLLEWGRMEAGRRVYDLRVEDLGEVVRDALAHFAPINLQADADVVFTIEPDLPPALVDRSAVTAAVLNLVSNAYKYGGHPRHIEVRVAADPTRSRVAVSVRDNGQGIPRSEHKRIFQKFYRRDDSFSRTAEGYGLGLSIVSHIVRGHRGRIHVDSAPGSGSTFTIDFPCAVPAPPPRRAQASPGPTTHPIALGGAAPARRIEARVAPSSKGHS